MPFKVQTLLVIQSPSLHMGWYYLANCIELIKLASLMASLTFLIEDKIITLSSICETYHHQSLLILSFSHFCYAIIITLSKVLLNYMLSLR